MLTATSFLTYPMTLILCLTPFFLLERFFSAPVKPRFIHYWWPRLIFLIFIKSVVAALALTFPFTADDFTNGPLTSALMLKKYWSEISPVFSWVCAFLIFTFIHYWTHVARHRLPLLWRWCHQMHHSSERFEASMSLYAHPFEAVLLRVAFAATAFFTGLNVGIFSALGLFYLIINGWMHSNILSPRWLGYIVFRPEQHSHHHAGGEYNFGVIPLWDILFGTFQNPQHHAERVGFKSDSDKKFFDYLLGR